MEDKTIEKKVESKNLLSKPPKKILILFLAVVFILLAGSAILGYFYYSKTKQYNTLLSEKEQLRLELEAKTKELEETQGSIPDTDPLEDQISDLETKIAKAQAYNAFFKYLNSVIEIHNGFTGWTDAEYQTARGLAQKTGSSSFLAVVDNAWTNQQQPVTDRLVSVWKAIAQGIENSLK